MFQSVLLIIILARVWVCRRQRLKMKATDYLILVALVCVCTEPGLETVLDLLEMKGEKQVDPNDPVEKYIPIVALSAEDLALYLKVCRPICNLNFRGGRAKYMYCGSS
jgi:hypothetical protein